MNAEEPRLAGEAVTVCAQDVAGTEQVLGVLSLRVEGRQAGVRTSVCG